MHPDFPDWKSELSRIAGLDIKGIKLHPVYQGVDFDDLRFLRMVRTFGADHLLFGTDSPWDGQTEALARFRTLPLADEEKNAILGGNAQRLLNL